MALPTYFGSGAFTAGTVAITPPFPASTLANDIALLVVESENQVITLTTANGFVEITGSPQGTGTAGTAGSSRLAVYWKRLVGGDAAPVVAASGDHNTAQIHVFRGCITSGNPWDITAGGVDTVSDTSGSVPGATTTTSDCLVVLLYSSSNDATATTNFSAQANADLVNILERQDNTNTAGLGGGHGLTTGEKKFAGAYQATAVTYSVASLKGLLSVALKSANPTTYVLPGLGAPVFAGFAPIIALAIRVGLGAPVFTGFAPNAVIGNNQVAFPGTGGPVFTGFAPTVLVTTRIAVGVGAPVFTGFAPSVVAAVTAKPGVGAPVFDGFAPSVVLSDNKIIAIGKGAPVFTGFGPTVLVGPGTAGLATPGRGQPVFTGFAPLILGSLWNMEARHHETLAIPSPHHATCEARPFTGDSITRTYTWASGDIDFSDGLRDFAMHRGMGE